MSYIKAGYDATNQKTIIVYKDEGNSNYGTAVVGTVSGTSISFGTPVVFESANTQEMGIVHDPVSTKMLIVYKDSGNSSYGTGIVGTVSGDTISFGSEVVYLDRNSQGGHALFHTAANQLYVIFNDANNSNKIRMVPAPRIVTGKQPQTQS